MNLFKKPSNCKCEGGYKANAETWVVLQRRPSPKSSQLKCLACGWKWWSTRNYVLNLPDHVERSRSGLTDEDILGRILDGTLTILVNEPRVFSFTARYGWNELRQIERTSNGSTYRFVEIYHKGKRKKVALHRLVWMFAHRELVPEGYDVDHIEGKYSDAIDNLRLLESGVNRSRGRPVKPQEEELPF